MAGSALEDCRTAELSNRSAWLLALHPGDAKDPEEVSFAMPIDGFRPKSLHTLSWLPASAGFFASASLRLRMTVVRVVSAPQSAVQQFGNFGSVYNR
jgi:hypothetical protein